MDGRNDERNQLCDPKSGSRLRGKQGEETNPFALDKVKFNPYSLIMQTTLTAEITNLVPILKVQKVDEGKPFESTWITISIPNGWDDCKKLTKKVLEFEGVNFVWRSWNSDKNECYFVSGGDVAKIKR